MSKIRNNSSKLNDQKSHLALQAEANVDCGHDIPSTTESTTIRTRQKRGFLGFLALDRKNSYHSSGSIGIPFAEKEKKSNGKGSHRNAE